VVLEQNMTGTTMGENARAPGTIRRVTSSILHVFAFRHGRICRERVWIDSGPSSPSAPPLGFAPEQGATVQAARFRIATPNSRR
jgi:hypothetical protein